MVVSHHIQLTVNIVAGHHIGAICLATIGICLKGAVLVGCPGIATGSHHLFI
jgi:hypothetical protein